MVLHRILTLLLMLTKFWP